MIRINGNGGRVPANQQLGAGVDLRPTLAPTMGPGSVILVGHQRAEDVRRSAQGYGPGSSSKTLSGPCRPC